MQPCSSFISGCCSCVLLVSVVFQPLQLSEARHLQGAHHMHTSAHAAKKDSKGQLPGAASVYTDTVQPQNVPGFLPVCSNAYAIVNQPRVSSVGPSWGSYMPVSIGGVTDPAEQHVVIAISKVEQNEPTYNQHSRDDCPDAQVNGLNSLFVRFESSQAGPQQAPSSMQSGRTYFVYFTAKNEAGLSCDGVVKVCVPSSGHSNCLTTDNDVLYDSRMCAPSIPLLSMD